MTQPLKLIPRYRLTQRVAHWMLTISFGMLLLSGLGELYDNPNPSPAEMMEIIKWTHVYDRIDKAFNRAWQLAKAIEGIVLKNA